MSVSRWPDAEADYRDWLDTQYTEPTRAEVADPEEDTTTPLKESHGSPTADR